MSRQRRDWTDRPPVAPLTPTIPVIDIDRIDEEVEPVKKSHYPINPVTGWPYPRHWEICQECGREVLIESKEYYHKLSCSKSNGVGYLDEREPIAHKVGCLCNRCQPPKEKKNA